MYDGLCRNFGFGFGKYFVGPGFCKLFFHSESNIVRDLIVQDGDLSYNDL